MEKQVLVNESSLINIADALRGHVGDVITEKIYIPNSELCKISKTSNAISLTEFNGDYPTGARLFDTVVIPGASSIKVTIAYQTEGTGYDWVQIVPSKVTSAPNTTTYPKYGGQTLTQKEFEFANTNTVTFYFQSDNSGGKYLGYYAEVRGYDAEGNVLPDYETVTKPAVFKPSEMADIIATKLPTQLKIFTTRGVSGSSGSYYCQTYECPPDMNLNAASWLFFARGCYTNSSYSTGDFYVCAQEPLLPGIVHTRTSSGSTLSAEIPSLKSIFGSSTSRSDTNFTIDETARTISINYKTSSVSPGTYGLFLYVGTGD